MAAPLLTLVAGGIVNLTGDNSGVSMNGAFLTAQCDGGTGVQQAATPAVQHCQPHGDGLRCYFGGDVRVPCVGGKVSRPCAAASASEHSISGYPALYACEWHAESGATEVARDVAAASSEALASDGSVLAHAAYVDCAAPSIVFRLAALGSNPTAELALKVRHFLPRPGQEFIEHAATFDYRHHQPSR